GGRYAGARPGPVSQAEELSERLWSPTQTAHPAVVLVEVLVERQETLQVKAFGIEGSLTVPGRFRHQVRVASFTRLFFASSICAKTLWDGFFLKPARCQFHVP